jgi:hypothetical protein
MVNTSEMSFEKTVIDAARKKIDRLIYTPQKSKKNLELLRQLLKYFSRYALGERSEAIFHNLARILGLQKDREENNAG